MLSDHEEIKIIGLICTQVLDLVNISHMIIPFELRRSAEQ